MPITPDMGGLAARPVSTQPDDPGIIDRILAMMGQKRGPSAPTPNANPANVQEGIRILEAEEPGFTASLVAPKSTLPLLGTLQVPAGAQAATTPFGNIRYDPAALKGLSAQDVADTLLHEYTHVKQNRPRGVIGQILSQYQNSGLPYGQRPDELEAWQAERQRRARMGRTKYDGAPSFSGDIMAVRDNIPLAPEHP